MSTNTDNGDTDADQPVDVPHDRYHETSRKAYGSQDDVADAWADGAYPTHNADSSRTAVLYTGSPAGSGYRTRSTPDVKGRRTNFYGEQEADGTGTLWHYSTREAIRTRNGLIISNRQCWGSGFAHCSTPSDTDGSAPLMALEDLLADGEDVFDIVRVESDSDGSLIHLDSGAAIYTGRDSTVTRGNDPFFAFRLDADEVARLSGPGEARELLKPAVVSELLDGHGSQPLVPLGGVPDGETPERVYAEVVGADEYTKTRFRDPDEETIEVEGLEVKERYGRDYGYNHKHYREEYRGQAIIRQGEWFFVPLPLLDPDHDYRRWFDSDKARDPDKPYTNRSDESALGSHVPRDQYTPLPTDCPECGATSLAVADDGNVACAACGVGIDRPVYVRGTVRHGSNEHSIINLGETWHLAVTHDRDCLTFHTGSRGGRRGGGGGWD